MKDLCLAPFLRERKDIRFDGDNAELGTSQSLRSDGFDA